MRASSVVSLTTRRQNGGLADAGSPRRLRLSRQPEKPAGQLVRWDRRTASPTWPMPLVSTRPVVLVRPVGGTAGPPAGIGGEAALYRSSASPGRDVARRSVMLGYRSLRIVK